MEKEKKTTAPGLMFYFDDFGTVLDTMDDREVGCLVRALFRFFGTGEEPEHFENRTMDMGYRLLKPVIERDRNRYLKTCEHRSEAMKRYWGGVHDAKDTIAANGINANENANANASASESDTEGDAHTPRHKYGEYGNVLLSDDDLAKLKTEFPRDWQARIEELSTAMESKGLHYRNHLATIRAWARKDAGRPPAGTAVPEAPKQKKSRCREDLMRDPENPRHWILKPEVAEREAAEAAGAEPDDEGGKTE